jgi:isopenicillin N synthase-like dioxygenase
MARQVPIVDFRDFLGTDAERRRFVAQVGGALEDLGFVSIENHGIAPETLARAYADAARVFALPDAIKRASETPADARQRGYTPFGIEHAKDRPVADMKEFWQVGRRTSGPGPLPQNRFPAEVPAFAETIQDLFDQLEGFANHLLDAVGQHLALEPGFFRKMVEDSNSVLRVIHYPPLSEAIPEGALRAAPHEDINLMTVLPASTEGGLELLTRDGEWLAVSPPPGVMICDTGDMMALVTAGRLPATTHRVVNPAGAELGRPRYSMPFFLHPHPDVTLTPLWPSDRQPIKARDFLHQRLVEIGVA